MGDALGPDDVLTTYPESIQGLPDGRVFERVTPVENNGASAYVPTSFGRSQPLSEGQFSYHTFRAAADGHAVVYMGDPNGEAGTGNGGYGPAANNTYLSERVSGGNWRQVNLIPPGRVQAHYQAFSNDLKIGFLDTPSGGELEEGVPSLSPLAPEKGYDDLYQRNLSTGESAAFVTAPPPNMSPRYFGSNSGVVSKSGGSNPLMYVGSSNDSQESFFEANDSLAAPAVFGGENLYAWSGGKLSLVNVLPDGDGTEGATFGGNWNEVSYFPNEFPFLAHVISSDGSRAFWTDTSTEDLYVRIDPTSADAHTQLIAEGAYYMDATLDGAQVYFTKGGEVTKGGELYSYDFTSGRTTDLTPGVDVVGVVGTSEDGEYVYYVNMKNELMVWHDGSTREIAALVGGEDLTKVGLGETIGPDEIPPFGANQSVGQPDDLPQEEGGLGYRTSEVSADGSAVVFMSASPLKAVNDPSGNSSDGDEEVYVYEAQGEQLFCTTCNPDGEPPQAYSEFEEEQLAGGYVPVSWQPTYQPRFVSENGGRVFFDSSQPLVTQDSDRKQDVYEWERNGEGSCTQADGCVFLLSGGDGTSASWLLDASSNGDDVFVISRTSLVPGDPYDSFSVYDASVHGSSPPVSPECSGTAARACRRHRRSLRRRPA